MERLRQKKKIQVYFRGGSDDAYQKGGSHSELHCSDRAIRGSRSSLDELDAAIVTHKGYADFVLGRDNSLIYQLPTGTYGLENSDLLLDAAHAIALEAAQATALKFGLFVADFNLGKSDLEGEEAMI